MDPSPHTNISNTLSLILTTDLKSVTQKSSCWRFNDPEREWFSDGSLEEGLNWTLQGYTLGHIGQESTEINLPAICWIPLNAPRLLDEVACCSNYRETQKKRKRDGKPGQRKIRARQTS